MSATNRGAARRADDYYATPAWATEVLLDWFERQGVSLRGTILDPFAGDGAILRVLKDRAWPWVERLAAVELRPEAEPAIRSVAGWHRIADWFELAQGDLPKRHIIGPPFNLCASDPLAIITNPPYSRAEDAINSCRAVADFVVMLLRLPFYAGQRRRALFAEHPPSNVLVLAKRPSFTDGGTDATDYAWFVWDRGHRGPARLERLEATC